MKMGKLNTDRHQESHVKTPSYETTKREEKGLELTPTSSFRGSTGLLTSR